VWTSPAGPLRPLGPSSGSGASARRSSPRCCSQCPARPRRTKSSPEARCALQRQVPGLLRALELQIIGPHPEAGPDAVLGTVGRRRSLKERVPSPATSIRAAGWPPDALAGGPQPAAGRNQRKEAVAQWSSTAWRALRHPTRAGRPQRAHGFERAETAPQRASETCHGGPRSRTTCLTPR